MMKVFIFADIITVAAIMFAFVRGYKTGGIKAAYRLVALVGSIAVAASLQGRITAGICAGRFAERVHTGVERTITETLGTNEKIPSVLLPESVLEEFKEGTERGIDNTCAWITTAVIRIIVCCALFIAARLAFYLAFLIIGAVFKLPLLKNVNNLLGGIIGAAQMIVFIYIICSAASVFFMPQLRAMCDNTLLVRLFIKTAWTMP